MPQTTTSRIAGGAAALGRGDWEAAREAFSAALGAVRELGAAEIAERLVLGLHTVRRHVANVRTKLRLPSRPRAWRMRRAGLL